MKIALVTCAFPLKEDDEIVFPASWELANALHDEGHEILVLTFSTSQKKTVAEQYINGMRVLSLAWSNTADYTCFGGTGAFAAFSWQLARAHKLAYQFAEELEKFQPDVIESQEFDGFGFFLAAMRKFPLVLRCYGPLSFLLRSGELGKYQQQDIELAEGMEYASILAADKLIAICDDVAQRLSTETGRPISDFEIIRIPYTISEASTGLRITRSNNAYPVLFYWGRVEPQKGVDILIDALPILVKELPNFRLIIGGKESHVAGASRPYGDELRAKLKRHGLLKHVEFRGFMTREAIRRTAEQADICVFPSKYETACYTAIEAVSYGAAVVATKAGGLPEYHSHGESAWLVDAYSPKALAEGIVTVATNKELRQKLRTSGVDYIRRICLPQMIARQSIDVYAKAIDAFKEQQHNQTLAGARRADLAFYSLASHLAAAAEQPSLLKWARSTISTELDRAWHKGFDAGVAHVCKPFSAIMFESLQVFKRVIANRIHAKCKTVVQYDHKTAKTTKTVHHIHGRKRFVVLDGAQRSENVPG